MDKKVSNDSLVDNIEISDDNFLGRKTVDYSTFNKGTTIPQRYHERFLGWVNKGDQLL